MGYLLIFSIGPVQDFIATARRSRDLWYGSWMLSELSRAIAKAILSQSGRLIFPSNPESLVSVPNKIIATANEIKKIVDAVNIAVEKRMGELRDEALRRVNSSTYDKQLAEAQIKALPELYWIGVPYQENNYKAAREEAEALLTARKVTRNFNQAAGSNKPKSSLDGARESVIDEAEYPQRNEDDKVKKDKVTKLYNNYHARQGERLSGVDLLKRLGARADEPDFKSTSHMAAIPFIEKLDKKWGKARRIDFIESIRQLFATAGWNMHDENDGALLFESRLTDWMPAGKEQDKLRKEFNALLKNSLGDTRPSPYYALLRADGDNMGKVIDAQNNEEKHRELSGVLSKFAAEVKPIVEKANNGLLIYSGGDDVLAYLPINKALDCAVALEKTFKNTFREDPSNEESTNKFSTIVNGETISPTLSVGIVIAHHLDPLSDVLQLARESENIAKEKVKRKNGLAITLSKRSGVDRTVVGKFSELYVRLTEMIKLTNENVISAGTAYELQELQRELPNDFPIDGMKAEALRIVRHKQSANGAEISGEKKKEFIRTVEGWLARLSFNENDTNSYSLRDMANEMIIAKALANETETEESKETKI